MALVRYGLSPKFNIYLLDRFKDLIMSKELGILNSIKKYNSKD